MRSSKAQRLIKRYVLGSLTGFAVKGRLLYSTPVQYVLRGYYFEDSSFDANAFTVWAFVQPLYVPARSVVFSLGRRLGTLDGGRELWWTVSDNSEAEIMKEVLTQIQREAEPRFEGIVDPEKLLPEIEALAADKYDLYALEAAAYSLVLIGDSSRAVERLTILDNTVASMNLEVGWVSEVGTRSTTIRSALARGVGQAQRILETWADETAASIRLPRQRRVADGM